jgi:hypothetical protein
MKKWTSTWVGEGGKARIDEPAPQPVNTPELVASGT